MAHLKYFFNFAKILIPAFWAVHKLSNAFRERDGFGESITLGQKAMIDSNLYVRS